MKYSKIVQGRFLERPNRFIAITEINGQVETCHVKNTGRCRELLVPGAEVWLEKSSNPNRKTAYDLVAVKKGSQIINMDSQAPNRAVREWLEQKMAAAGCGIESEKGKQKAAEGTGRPDTCRSFTDSSKQNMSDSVRRPFTDIVCVRPEFRYGDSRIDFYGETGGDGGKRRFLIEVKGVTLEEEGIARFPDAPTERGVKHMLELEKAVKEGYEAWILFVIQMKGIRWFEPNDRTHPQFGETLRRVRKAGVGVLAYDCLVTADEIKLDQPIEIKL